MSYTNETPLERIISDSAKAIEDLNSSERPAKETGGGSGTRLLVFVSNNCQRSGVAKEVVNNQSLNYEIYNIDEKEGRDIAYKWGILTVPTILLVDSHDHLIHKWPGAVPRPNEIEKFLP